LDRPNFLGYRRAFSQKEEAHFRSRLVLEVFVPFEETELMKGH
jgi:hypothetical protein